jgi:hypothetical protein
MCTLGVNSIAMYCVQQALAEAVAAQQRSTQLRNELAHANAMLRLQERKYSVCGALIEEVVYCLLATDYNC